MHGGLTTATAIEYPAIAFSKGHLEVVPSLAEMTRCGKAALKNGWFDGMTIIDAATRRYRVRRVREAGSAGPFWGFSLMRSRQIRVELELSEPEPLKLEEVKREVVKVVRRHRDFWSAGYSVEELERLVRDASNVGEIAGYLS